MTSTRAPANRVARALSCAMIAGGMLSGCSTVAMTQLPPGVTIDVYQSRIDYSEHKLEVAVSNGTKHPFTITELRFSSPAFTPPVEYDRAPTIIRPGATTDLRLLLPPADCDAVTGAPDVTLSFEYENGAGTASVEPNDRIGQLPVIAAEDCRGDAVSRVATIAPAPTIDYTVIDGAPVALLEFTATPTGSGGVLVIDEVRGTVLLSLRNGTTGVVGDSVPLALDVGASPVPVSFTLQLRPARCDPHVVLEDKRGTFFTFTVTTAQDTGRIFIGVNDAERTELYAFVGRVCGWA